MEAEILRRHGLPVCHDPSLCSSEFFLVLSFGRCKFRLSEISAASILQAVIGGSAPLFRVISLGDRVFRFSVSSQAVGFHIYGLRSYECSNFKIFFNLWHDEGPNFRTEYRRWEAEERAKWTTLAKRHSSPLVCAPPLTGANSIPVSSIQAKLHSHGNQTPNFKSLISPSYVCVSVFKRIHFGPPFASNDIKRTLNDNRGILGKHPKLHGPLRCDRCLVHGHFWSNCPLTPRCKSCYRFGHSSARCSFPPRFARQSRKEISNHAYPRMHRSPLSMTSGSNLEILPRRFASFGEYFSSLSGRSPPSPVTVPWRLS